jgi:hypothetical protein
MLNFECASPMFVVAFRSSSSTADESIVKATPTPRTSYDEMFVSFVDLIFALPFVLLLSSARRGRITLQRIVVVGDSG